MRRITAIFLTLVMCLSFVGSLAYGEDIVTENLTEPAPELPASSEVPVPEPPIPPQQNPGSQEQPSTAEEPWYSPDEQPITPDIPITPEPSEDKPEEEHGLPEDQEHGETASEPPADEAGETPVSEPEKPEGQLVLSLDCSTDGFVAGRPETAILRAVVTRSDAGIEFPSAVVWESSDSNISIVPQIETTEDALSKTFYAMAEYSGVLSMEGADITASAQNAESNSIHINVSHDQFKAVITDETGTGFAFALKNKSANTFNAGDELTFVFTDSEKNANKDHYKDFVWEASMDAADGSGAYPVHVKNEENGEFTLYTDSGFSTRHKATGDVIVMLTGMTAKAYMVIVAGDAEEYRTVFAPQIAEKEKDYVFYIAHPEDQDPAKEDFESKYIYSLPRVTIGGKEYNGYKLERIEEKKEFEGKTYSKYWQITIPEDRVNGDIIIDANTRRMKENEESGYPVNLGAIAGKQLVPFAENDKLTGTTVTDREDEEKQEYYFYYIKDPAKNIHPIYSVNSVGYPLSPLPVSDEPEAEGSHLYRISNITGPVTVGLGYNVSKSIDEVNNAHLLVELPGETVNKDTSYSFIVRSRVWNGQKVYPEVNVSIGTHFAVNVKEIPSIGIEEKEDDFGQYVVFTVPTSAIDGDMVIAAKSPFPVNYRVKFVDNYNTGNFAAFAYKSFDFTIPSSVLGSQYPTSVAHVGEISPGSALSFEMLEKPLYTGDTADGSCSDPELSQYRFEFTATMGGQSVNVTPGPTYSGGLHQMYVVNDGKPLTGDVLIKANFVPRTYNYIWIGKDKIASVTNQETCVRDNLGGYVTIYTGRTSEVPAYRYTLQANMRPEARKIYIRAYNERENILHSIYSSTGKTSARMWGDQITNNVVLKALGYDELDVLVSDRDPKKSNLTETVFLPDRDACQCGSGYYYNGCIAKKGENFVFTALSTTEVSIKVGDTTLKEGLEYAVTTEGNQKKYTIPGQYMIGDTTIWVSAARPIYNVTFSGKYEYAMPVGKNEPVQKDTVKAGEDYSFYLAEGVLSISIGKKNAADGEKLLREGYGYTKNGILVTIPAASITDDIYITISQAVPRRTPVYTSKKKTESGTELDIETWEYLVLDEEKIMYMLIVHADPKDGEFICYNNNKMLWVESYDGYVWFEVSEERPEDFAILSYDLVDALTDADILHNLTEAAEDPDAPIELSKYEEVYNITDDDEISCDVNEDGKVDEEDLKIMRRIFNCEFEDFDDIPMRCFVLSDADNSGVLDMCDAEIIKCNFDRSEEKK